MTVIETQQIEPKVEEEKRKAGLHARLLSSHLQVSVFPNREQLAAFLEDTAAVIREEVGIENGSIAVAHPGDLSDEVFVPRHPSDPLDPSEPRV